MASTSCAVIRIRRQGRVPRVEIPLDGDRTLHRIQHTGKLGQQVIPWGVHDATAVLLDEGGDDVPVDRPGADGSLFILAHQAAILHDIGTEDRRQFARHPWRDPGGRLFARSHDGESLGVVDRRRVELAMPGFSCVRRSRWTRNVQQTI